MGTEPTALTDTAQRGAPEEDSVVAVPRTRDEKREYLRHLAEFRAYLKAKYGTFDDSVAILAKTRERHDDRP
ncbi:hypothetical protein CMK11_11475 [Candidatus Poribacteria bacterium]|jgi:hypothetical protein|nr:hypothetical protein [Candidatus Poribacteria bacterium]